MKKSTFNGNFQIKISMFITSRAKIDQICNQIITIAHIYKYIYITQINSNNYIYNIIFISVNK